MNPLSITQRIARLTEHLPESWIARHSGLVTELLLCGHTTPEIVEIARRRGGAECVDWINVGERIAVDDLLESAARVARQIRA